METITLNINTLLLSGCGLFILGCGLGYWEKCIQLRIAGLREDLRLATKNTIKSAFNVHSKVVNMNDSRKALKETIAEAE